MSILHYLNMGRVATFVRTTKLKKCAFLNQNQRRSPCQWRAVISESFTLLSSLSCLFVLSSAFCLSFSCLRTSCLFPPLITVTRVRTVGRTPNIKRCAFFFCQNPSVWTCVRKTQNHIFRKKSGQRCGGLPITWARNFFLEISATFINAGVSETCQFHEQLSKKVTFGKWEDACLDVWKG